MVISFICFSIGLFVLNYFLKPFPHLLILGIISTVLLVLSFNQLYDWKTNSYLFSLWFMSLFLSLYDYLYFIVEPTIFYLLSILTLILYFTCYSFSYYNLIQPIGIFLFFLALDFFLPNSFGGGDVKLLMLYGILLPFQQLLLLIMLASLLGIIFFFLFLKKRFLTRLPFVPFLTIALFIISIFYIK